MMHYIAVFFGGAIGSVSRYALSGAVYRVFGQDFPYGTLAVNILGCAIIGAVMELADTRFLAPITLKALLAAGFCGGFTTFSTFSFETLAMMSSGSYVQALYNIAASILSCLGATWAGMQLAKLI
jgi:fluoride exporter